MFKENIPLARLIESSEVLCWSAKWLGKDEILFDSIFRNRPRDMLKNIYDLLEEADVVIHYNGASFDIPTLNKEFLIYNFSPPSPYKQVDLIKTSRSQFRFTSNKLDYICNRLNLGSKTETSFQLWVDCMNKDPKAWKQMEEYNRNDVVMLEKLYYKLLPWIKNHPNVGLYNGTDNTCPNCGSSHHHRRGYSHTAACTYQRFRCTDCGSWFRSRKNEATTERYATL